MRIVSQSELLRATKFELQVLLREITASLPHLAEGSHELRIAHSICTISASPSQSRSSGRADGPGRRRAPAGLCRFFLAVRARHGFGKLAEQSLELQRVDWGAALF
jgi:hypothetical protein